MESGNVLVTQVILIPYIGQGLEIFSISMSLITASCRKENPNPVIHFVEKDINDFNFGIYLYISSQPRIKVRTVV